MGQYYTPIIRKDDGCVLKYYSHDYDNGLKLTEHSYIGNNFVNVVMNAIKDNPCQIAWVGDYAETKNMTGWYKWFVEQEKDYHNYVQGGPELDFNDENVRGYFINETKKQYVDIKEFYEQCKFPWFGSESVMGCLNPLPILTAMGNGLGGGDYFGTDMDKVGMWAMDKIAFTETLPEGYKKLEVKFKEK